MNIRKSYSISSQYDFATYIQVIGAVKEGSFSNCRGWGKETLNIFNIGIFGNDFKWHISCRLNGIFSTSTCTKSLGNCYNNITSILFKAIEFVLRWGSFCWQCLSLMIAMTINNYPHSSTLVDIENIIFVIISSSKYNKSISTSTITYI